jgi:hypothetical protein
MNRLYLTFLLTLAFVVTLAAQDVRVTAAVDSSNYLIGQWVTLRMTVDAPASATLRLPSTDDDVENGEFISAAEAEVESRGDRRRYRQDVVATVFDTGSIALRLRVRYTMPGDTTVFVAFSEPVALELGTVELDTTQTFRDIKDVLDVPLTIWDYLLYLAVALLLAGLIWFGYRRYRRRKEHPVELAPEPVPEVPVHVLALQALERLRERRLWQNGEHKTYQSELTDILRHYIERRYRIPAMEQPTSEIMPGVAMLGLDPGLVERVERTLRVADMTKFARYVPSSMQHEEGMSLAVDFVEVTRPHDGASDSRADGASTETGGTQDV